MTSSVNKVLPICVDDKYGYINLGGEIVVPCQYDYASDFSEGLATVRRQYNYLDHDKQEITIIDSAFRSLGTLVCSYWGRYSDGLMMIERNGKMGFVDTSLRVQIPPIFDNARDFVDDLCTAAVDTWNSWGVIDRLGRWVIQPQYKDVWPFQKGEQVTAFQVGVPEDPSKKTPAPDSMIDLPYALTIYNNARASGMSVKEASIVSGFELIRPAPENSSCSESVSDWYFYVSGTSTTVRTAWGLIDRQGNTIIEPRFDSLGWPNGGMLAAGIRVGNRHKEGIINERGEWLVQPQWDNTDGGFTDDLMSAAIFNKWGLVDRDGAWVIKPQYTNTRSFRNGLCGVYVGGRRDLDNGLCDGKYGFINKAGEMVIEPRFDDVSDFEDGICKVELIAGDLKDNYNRSGYIDTEGNYIWEPTR